METEKQVNLDLIGVGDLTLKLYRWLDQRKNEVIEELNKNLRSRYSYLIYKRWNGIYWRLQCMLVGLNYEKVSCKQMISWKIHELMDCFEQRLLMH